MQKVMDIYNKYVKEMFLLLLFQSIAMGIFFMLLTSKVSSSCGTAQKRFLENILGLDEYSNTLRLSGLNLSYEIFLKSFVLCAVQFIVLGFLFYIFINALQKNNISFLSILFTLRRTLLISGFFLFISIPFINISMLSAFVLLAGGFFLTMLVNYKSIKEIPGINQSSGVYITLTAYIIYIVFFSICIFESIR